ncbi:MAG: hypothetical protein VCB59_13325, partial [Gammaproteobacteria bacterium]
LANCMSLVNLMSVGLESPSKPTHNKASVERATPESSKELPPKLDTKLASKSAQNAGETTPANNPKKKQKTIQWLVLTP